MASAKARRGDRYKTWIDDLPAGKAAEVRDVKVAFQAGETGLPARALAQSLIDDLREHGFAAASLHTVSQWLLKK